MPIHPEPLDIDLHFVKSFLPSRTNGQNINKGTFGHVLVIAGSPGLGGAAILAAEAAMRTGAGLVTLAFPQTVEAAILPRLSPVVMTRSLRTANDGSIATSEIESLIAEGERMDAIAIGPGLGANQDRFVLRIIEGINRPIVIDADALNAVARAGDSGAAMLRHEASHILTPHPGEMARLLQVKTESVQANRIESVTSAASKFNAVTVLKGHHTLVASPDGTLRRNTTGHAGLATAGSGDVLTGIIASFVAQGLSADEAAAVGVYVHGHTADLIFEIDKIRAGLIATDLINKIPTTLANLAES